MKRRDLLLGTMSALLASAFASSESRLAQAAGCQYQLGFKALHDLIPDVVGDCKTDEYHNPENGDGLQETIAWHGKGGLLVWRKADNWTAFTDGANTWINGPNGIQKRSNDARFDWEQDAQKPKPTPAPTPGVQLTRYSDAELEYSYPFGWTANEPNEYRLGQAAPAIDGNVPAALLVRRAVKLGAEYPIYAYSTSPKRVADSATQYLDQILDATKASQDYTIYKNRETRQIGGSAGIVQPYTQVYGARDVARLGNGIGTAAVVQKGQCVYYLDVWTRERFASSFVGLFDPIVNSFVAKRSE